MVLISEQMDQIVIGKELIKGWQNNVANNFAAKSVSTVFFLFHNKPSLG